MKTVLRGLLPTLARALAQEMLEQGVQCRVVDELSTWGGYMPGKGSDVLVLNDHDADKALVIAAKSPLWRDSAIPDGAEPAVELARLDSSVVVNCPACGAPISPALNPSVCPSCTTPIDATALVVDQLGPEALEACVVSCPIEAPPPVEDPEAGQALDVPCLCGYSLVNLPIEGACPECGRAYHKDWLRLSAHIPAGMRGRPTLRPDA